MTVFGFNSFEEAMEWERKQQEAVEAALAPEQRAINWGDKFMRVWEDPYGGAADPGEGHFLAIFGDIYTFEALAQIEEPDTMETLKRMETRFLFAECYSVVEPEGEPGSVNRWDMWPISTQEFERAKAAGWDVTDYSVWPWFKVKFREMVTKRGVIPGPPPDKRQP